MFPRLPPVVRRRIVTLGSTGSWSAPEIAFILGLSRASVWRVLNAAGVDPAALRSARVSAARDREVRNAAKPRRRRSRMSRTEALRLAADVADALARQTAPE